MSVEGVWACLWMTVGVSVEDCGRVCGGLWACLWRTILIADQCMKTQRSSDTFPGQAVLVYTSQ